MPASTPVSSYSTTTTSGSSVSWTAISRQSTNRIGNAERPASAKARNSSHEIAARANVAVGTVFRHFPTKDALLRAILEDLLGRLADEAASLAEKGNPATALFDFFTQVVERAADRRGVVELLTAPGQAFSLAEPIASLDRELQRLLDQARRAGAVRDDVQLPEVIALLTSTCHGALQGGWAEPLRRRVRTVIFDGLRPPAA